MPNDRRTRILGGTFLFTVAPDLHSIWTPPDDADFSLGRNRIKSTFSKPTKLFSMVTTG